MAVEELSQRKKEVYRMSINDGLSVEEIAESLDIDVRTVSNTLRLAVNEVKEKVAGLLSFFVFII